MNNLKPRVTGVVLASCLMALTGITTASTPTQQKTRLHAVKASLQSVRTLAQSRYQAGTNVVIVNFGHNPIEVMVSELESDVIVNPISEDNNVYYIYSARYYPGLHVTIYDNNTGEELSSGYTDNPSTIEVRDADYARPAINKNSVSRHSVRVTYKHGI